MTHRFPLLPLADISPRPGVLSANGRRWYPNVPDRPDCAVFGPSGRYGIWGTNPWFFKVYSGDARARLGEARAELYRKLTPADKYDQKKFDKLKRRPMDAPYTIALCLKAGTNPKIPLLEEQAALAAAVQNMHLTATALGLAAYWSSGGYALRPETAELLELGENESCMGFFMVARPKVKDSWPMGYRKADWGDKVEWVE